MVAPVFFAAAIYTVLSILISATKSRSYAPLSPKLILWIFITCDVVATVVQILGAALIGVASSNRKDPTMANNILLGGLAFQAASFLLFIVLYSVFLWRARKVSPQHQQISQIIRHVAHRKTQQITAKRRQKQGTRKNQERDISPPNTHSFLLLCNEARRTGVPFFFPLFRCRK